MNSEKGICIQSVVPCRSEPSHKAEMCTQLLFGETYTVQHAEGEWLQILTDYDHYSGWIWIKQHCSLKEKEWEQLKKNETYIVQDYFQPLTSLQDNSLLIVPMGASLPLAEEQIIRIGTEAWKISKIRPSFSRRAGPKTLVKKALMLLGSPYMWGGRTPWGIDCSGFTQLVYKLCGIPVPRDASQQVFIGKEVAFVEEAKEGDLAFFHNEEGNIIHVGMIVGDKKIIHASGKVRIDSLDHFGIYNREYNKYTHYLRILKRILP